MSAPTTPAAAPLTAPAGQLPTSVAPARRSYRRAVADLRSVQKSARRAPAYTRWVNRRLGRYLAAAAYVRRSTPNQVTAISGVLTVAAIIVLAVSVPSWPVAITVGVLLLAGYALDSADGQLARLVGGGTPSGEWLDHVIDCVKTTGLHLALVVALYRSPLGRGAAAIALAYTFISALFFFSIILAEQIRRNATAGAPAAGGAGKASTLWSFALLPNDFGVVALSFILLGMPHVFVVVYATLLACNAVFLMVKMPAWYRELRQLGAGAQ